MNMVDPSVWNPSNITMVELNDGQRLLDVDGVRGFLFHAELSFIASMAHKLPRGGKYLEIGSFMGLSAIVATTTLLRTGNTEAKVYCVDTWGGSVEHKDLDVIKDDNLFKTFKDNIARLKYEPWITACRGRSVDVVAQFEDKSLDLIFVDGDHTYEGCYADLEAWYPKLKEGGRFMGHDAIPFENPSCGVLRAVDDFAAKYKLKYKISPPPEAHFIWEIYS